jgi:hypothetical protein
MKTTLMTPRKTNAMTGAGQVPSSSTISKEKSSSDDADFTLVTYSRHSSGTVHTAMEKKTAKTNDDPETEMKMTHITTWKFKEFQQQIFPVIQVITTKTALKDHPFIQKWVKALKKHPTTSTNRARLEWYRRHLTLMTLMTTGNSFKRPLTLTSIFI